MSNLDKELIALESTASSFAHTYINDTSVRREYINATKTMSEDIMEQVTSGKLTIREGVEEAQSMRNQIMEIARDKTSPLGLAQAKEVKQTGVTLSKLFEKNAQTLFETSYDTLGTSQKEKVHLKIIESSGTSNPRINVMVENMSKLGKGLGLFSIAIAGYNVYESDNKLTATGREVATIGGGILGGAAAGASAGIWFGPIGVGVCSVIGAIAGGLSARELFDNIFDVENASHTISVSEDNHTTIEPSQEILNFSNTLDKEALEQRIDPQSHQTINITEIEDRQDSKIDTIAKAEEHINKLFPHLQPSTTNQVQYHGKEEENPNESNSSYYTEIKDTHTNTAFDSSNEYSEDEAFSSPKNHRPIALQNNLPQQTEEQELNQEEQFRQAEQRIYDDIAEKYGNSDDYGNDYDRGMEID